MHRAEVDLVFRLGEHLDVVATRRAVRRLIAHRQSLPGAGCLFKTHVGERGAVEDVDSGRLGQPTLKGVASTYTPVLDRKVPLDY